MKYSILFCLFTLIFSVDIEAAVEHLTNNAQALSTGNCSHYVANALEAGNFTFTRQPYAYQYWSNNILINIGYYEIERQNSYEIGDITVTENNSDHLYGHIAMWNGTKWISDFVQNSEYVYKENQPPIHYFRYNETNSDINTDVNTESTYNIVNDTENETSNLINGVKSSSSSFIHFGNIILFIYLILFII